MNPKLDSYIVYQFLKRLTTPFEKWIAYKHKIIDDKGNILRTMDELSDEEKNDWTKFDLLICNLKKELSKVAGGKQKMSSMIMALYFLNQVRGKKAAHSEQGLAATKGQVIGWAKMKDVKEDVAINNVGGGQIAGAGIGPQGEPPVRKRKKILARILPQNVRSKLPVKL